MIRVTFSPSEIEICQMIGKLRHAKTSAHGTEMKQDQSKNSLQMSIDGVFTEYAVSKVLNVHFDMNCEYRKFGADLVTSKKNKVDVKSTYKVGGNLNAVLWSNSKPADIYVLTEIRPTFINVVGWISKDDFIKDENIINVGNGDFYSIPQSYLEPL